MQKKDKPHNSMLFQRTIKKPITIKGIGLHTGLPQEIKVLPVKANSGISFNGKRLSIESVQAESGFTKMGAILTIEHLLSALTGLLIDNAAIYTKGTEIPILDGSALTFVKLLDPIELNVERHFIRVLRPVWFEDEFARVGLLPSEKQIYDVEINYSDTPAIGIMKERFELTEKAYRDHIAPARSFARMSDLEFLQAHGKALGASLDTGLAVVGDKILNPEGLRNPSEFVRHKILDAIGDMTTAGNTLLAEYRSIKGGHYHNNMLLKLLFLNPDNYQVF